MRRLDPVKAREFAVSVVKRLREAGYEALWTGGCVRDRLMGREPKDYDVATSALPDQIREVFGRRRTLAIGASFGVITVIGRRDEGQIDVATFRRDATYSDGRHPDSVTFCNAEEDARRRDFTVNGLFYDPLEDRVFDYVGGQADLAACIIRAIGNPADRLAEDKLRALRAIRFATTLGFDIEPATWEAVRDTAPQIRLVSAERITEELRRMLVHPDRPRAVELLRDASLLHEILPEATGVLPAAEPADERQAFAWDRTLRILEHLAQPSFAIVLAALLREIWLARKEDPRWYPDLCQRWRLPNDVAGTVEFCLRHEPLIRSANEQPWPRLQRILIDPRAGQLLDLAEAIAVVVDSDQRQVERCRELLRLPADELNPAPLITGKDLLALGIPRGPVYREILEQVRDAQLMRQLRSRDEAMDWVAATWGPRPGT